MFYFTTEPTVQPVTSVATLVAPAPSGSLAPVGEQPPADFMDSGEPDPPTGTTAAAPAEQPAAIEATGNTLCLNSCFKLVQLIIILLYYSAIKDVAYTWQYKLLWLSLLDLYVLILKLRTDQNLPSYIM